MEGKQDREQDKDLTRFWYYLLKQCDFWPSDKQKQIDQ